MVNYTLYDTLRDPESGNMTQHFLDQVKQIGVASFGTLKIHIWGIFVRLIGGEI